jgi:hypothetical protein
MWENDFRGARPRGPEADEQQHQHADAKQEQRLQVHEKESQHLGSQPTQ